MPGRHPLCRLPGAGLVANLELRKAINQQIREIWFALWSTLPDKQFHASPFRFVCTPEKAGQYANAWDVISMSWPVGFHDGLMYVVLLSFLSAFVFACQSWSFYMSSKLLTGYEEALRPLGFFWVVMWRTGFMALFPSFWINCVIVLQGHRLEICLSMSRKSIIEAGGGNPKTWTRESPGPWISGREFVLWSCIDSFRFLIRMPRCVKWHDCSPG